MIHPMRSLFDCAAAGRAGWYLIVFTLLNASLMAPRAGAGTIRHDIDPSASLDLGAAAKYASVGKFDLTKWQPGFTASGTLVDDNWVLTAAHALEGTTSGQFTVGSKTYGVSKWITHPRWDGALRRGYDLALVKLDGSVSDVAPATLYTGKKELGAVATFVGFGRNGNGLTGATEFDGLKRAGQNTIDGTLGPEQWPQAPTFRNKLAKNSRTFIVDFDNPTKPADSVTGASGAVALEYLISLGDSGGGAFVDFGGGPQLAGVNSFAEIPDGIDDSDYGDVTGHVRVSTSAKWIRNILKREARSEAAAFRRGARLLAKGGPGRLGRILSPELMPRAPEPGVLYDSPVVPEPSSLGLVLIAGVSLILRRSRG